MGKRNHGVRNIAGWQRMSQRQRVMVQNKALGEEVAQLRAELNNLILHHNQVVLRQEALLTLVLDAGHRHPDSGIILLDGGSPKAVGLTIGDYLDALRAKTEALLAREKAAEPPPAAEPGVVGTPEGEPVAVAPDVEAQPVAAAGGV